jgi:DNA polymerase III subunit epsilon
MKLSDLEVLYLDFQTTGMRPSSGHLLEAAWAVARAGLERVEIESSLVQLPEGEKVPYRVTEITGIHDQEMKDARPIEDVFDGLLEAAALLPEPKVLVIHYAQFEKPFLLDLFARMKQIEELPFLVICSHSLLKRLFPNLPSQNIRGAAGFFGDNIGQVKRAASHVQATHQIWTGLVAKLKEDGIEDLPGLSALLAAPKKAAKVRYDYRLERARRLELPDQPGVYRMLSKSGEVLYVGKATSLKSRVNSYFRGQRGRDRRKLEMLAQVWDLDVTSCQSALEAALLEADEIKRLNPPYNVVMKRGRRHLVFYSKDFDAVSKVQNEEHPIGPFRHQNWIEHLRMLARSKKSGNFEQIFFNPVDEETLKLGFELFLAAHGLEDVEDWSVRRLLAYGLHLARTYEEPAETETETETDADDDAATDPAAEATPEEIAGKFERLLRRSGQEYIRAREMTALLNARVHFSKGEISRTLEFGRGKPGGSAENAPQFPWQDLDVDTYDRLSVLVTELNKYEHRIERRT